jgi:hypothetical protein
VVGLSSSSESLASGGSKIMADSMFQIIVSLNDLSPLHVQTIWPRWGPGDCEGAMRSTILLSYSIMLDNGIDISLSTLLTIVNGPAIDVLSG